ncbi:MAG: CBS domain-containing protein [Streptosporangiaceae bacterium]
MTREDKHLDAMLRHLGAAYYDSLHGRAAAGDVSRALDQVAGHIGETPHALMQPPRSPAGEAAHERLHKHHGQFHSRVRDVMTTEVVTIDRITPFKDIARLLVEHHISGVPVLIMGRHVAGVVTEGDLIAARDKSAGTRRSWTGLLHHSTDVDRHHRLMAEHLMSAPAITIHPDATIAAAADSMSRHHIKRLPVVDSDGTLIGLVSRRDLLRVFLVPDEEIVRQVRELLADVLPGESANVTVTAHGGIVTLTGSQPASIPHGPLAAAIDLTWDIDGVVDVIDHISAAQPA